MLAAKSWYYLSMDDQNFRIASAEFLAKPFLCQCISCFSSIHIGYGFMNTQPTEFLVENLASKQHTIAECLKQHKKRWRAQGWGKPHSISLCISNFSQTSRTSNLHYATRSKFGKRDEVRLLSHLDFLQLYIHSQLCSLASLFLEWK